MTRPLIVLLSLLAPPAEAGPYLATIAIHLAAAERATPSPAPQPGVCANCNGTGRLGDGTVSVDCPQCVDGRVGRGQGAGSSGQGAVCRGQWAGGSGQGAGGSFSSSLLPPASSLQSVSRFAWVEPGAVRASGKPVLLLLTAADCGPCRLLESLWAELDATGRLAATAAELACVRDESPSIRAPSPLARRYDVRTFPTLLVLSPPADPERRALRIEGGAASAAELAARLDRARAWAAEPSTQKGR